MLPTIHGDAGPSNPIGAIRNQKYGYIRDLLRLAHTPGEDRLAWTRKQREAQILMEQFPC